MITSLIEFESHGDDRGMLISLEANINVPFDIRRVYYLFDTCTEAQRGFHAHKKLKQVLICVSGSCVIVLDDGVDRREVLLDDPGVGLYLESGIWREMHSFSEGAVLMVVASELYDEADYIRDYNEFISYLGEELRED